MAESIKSAKAHHGKKRHRRKDGTVFEKRIPGTGEKLLGGFRANERLGKATLAAVRHIAVNDPALGSLVEGRGEGVELLLGGSGVSTGEGGTEFFLARFDRGDHGRVAGVAFQALARAFFGRFDVGHGIIGARGENRTPDQGLMSPLLYR